MDFSLETFDRPRQSKFELPKGKERPPAPDPSPSFGSRLVAVVLALCIGAYAAHHFKAKPRQTAQGSPAAPIAAGLVDDTKD